MSRPRLTSLDRVLWPAAGFTKGDMIAYYESVAPALLPHLARRPLTLGRFPAGVEGRGFAQTECPGRPEWMRTVAVRLRSGEVRHQCVVDDLPGLLWVANLGSIELHGFISRGDRLEEPAAVVFDLDPGPGAGFGACCAVALRVRDELAPLGLSGVPKASGGLGLHVYVPLAPGHSFGDTRAFARELAGRLVEADPDAITNGRDRAARAGRVLVDWQPNAPRALMILPYSLRATDEPRVSLPLGWDEVEAVASGAAAPALTPGAALERVRTRGDLFAAALEPRQALPRAGLRQR